MNMRAITKVFLVLAAIGGGVISGCATKSEFQDLKDRMDALESNKIQSIEGQISSIDVTLGLLDQTDNQLDAYIKALKEQVLELEDDCSEERETLEAAIKALQTEDDSLHKRIAELKYYADSTLTDAMDWVKTTIKTLEEEYSKTVDVIAGIQANLDTLHTSITKEYQQAIEDVIGKSAESMKTWVNEQLTGYYDIATMNTKLDSLKSALNKQISEQGKQISGQGDDLKELIGQNTEDIETLESDLKQSKTDITDAYKKAIEDAITKYDGTITKTIKDEIDGVNETIYALDERVSDLETKVANLEKRMDKVDRTLKNLASITYIPKYSDGIERVGYLQTEKPAKFAVAQTITLRFDIYPAACADSIAIAYRKSVEDKTPSPLSARAVYTLTKANAGDFVNLDILNVKAEKDETTGKATGVLSVTIYPTALDRDFIVGNLEASVVLKVSSDYSNIQSDYIRLVPDINNESGLYYTISTEEPPVKLPIADISEDFTYKIAYWKSEDSDIAAIDKNGYLTAVSPGTVDLKAYNENKEEIVTCNVLVYNPPFIPVESITCDTPDQDIQAGNRLEITVTLLPANVTDQRIAFIKSSSAGHFRSPVEQKGTTMTVNLRTDSADEGNPHSENYVTLTFIAVDGSIKLSRSFERVWDRGEN